MDDDMDKYFHLRNIVNIITHPCPDIYRGLVKVHLN